MAQYFLTTSKLCEVREDGYSVIFDGETTPTKPVEVANLRELRAEFDTFRKECEASGKPWLVNARPSRSVARKFPGFDKATRRGGELFAFVNADKCQKETA